jgi:hypothetical protein
LGLKTKEAIIERTKEKKAWEESGKPWKEWVKNRQEERLKRRRQQEGEEKDDEWSKLESRSGSVASTSSRTPWGKESKQDWSVASTSSRAPWEARLGHGFDLEPRPMERIQDRLEHGFDFEPRALEERTARGPDKLEHGIVIEPWS